MTHISGFERSQLLLLPEAIDDYVVADNPVRFIDAFVDGLDLAAAGFKRVTPKVTGRPGYAPGDLLKLYIYGYLNRVRSSRRLEAECHRNIEVIWLLRTLKPDFKTIADFRSDNRAAFRAVFRQFTLLCRELNLFGRELLAVAPDWASGPNQGPRLILGGRPSSATHPARCFLSGWLRFAWGGRGTPGSVTLPNRARNKSLGMSGSRRGDDFTPRLHGRRPDHARMIDENASVGQHPLKVSIAESL